MINLPRILTSDLEEIARVRPVKLSYKLNKTPLSTATMVIRTVDAAVTTRMFAELFDTRGSIGVFRVANTETDYTGDPQTTLSLEHGIVTLSDDILFGYHEYGGTGNNIASVLAQLLALQGVVRWQLGTVDFTTDFQYSFENDNLLTAILSLAAPLTSEYLWDFDFTTTPWTLSLLSAPVNDASEIRRNRNLDGLKIKTDQSNQCTRLYALGYGEGVNQLTIASVNDGYKYLDDLTAQATWGIINDVYTETSITDAATLMAATQAQLDARKDPIVTITASAHELYELTGEPLDAFYLGRLCRVPLPDYDVMMDERVINIEKKDVFGSPTKATLVLANTSSDTSATLAALKRKTAIGELYSQGATNQYGVSFADNADAAHPARFKFRIDEGAVHVNSVSVAFELSAFRGYTTGAAAGGGTTSSSGGASETVVESVERTADVTVSTPTDPSDGTPYLYTENANGTVGMHKHLYSHKHSVVAYVTIPGITISVPAHTHDNPTHAHTPVLGIIDGETASIVTISVDGNAVPPEAIAVGEFDAVSYLAKDASGKITRGAWHTILFTPSGNTRIEASLHVKTFIRSISGGNY